MCGGSPGCFGSIRFSPPGRALKRQPARHVVHGLNSAAVKRQWGRGGRWVMQDLGRSY